LKNAERFSANPAISLQIVRPRLLCLVGPTASGKTGLAIRIAETLGGEIVSADSRQVYREMDVGTAKPTDVERARVRHHGLDLAAPDEGFDVARYRAVALEAITDVEARGNPVIVVGGTGLYVRALLYGLCPAPPRAPRVRAVLHAWAGREGVPALHRRLALVDPGAASRIHSNDAARIVRALEVALVSGRRLSDWQRTHGFTTAPFDALVLGLAVPTADLDARIAGRVDAMLAAGWLDEVRRLVARGYADDAPAWRTLGYPQMRGVVEGRTDLAAARAATVLATRRYAKRQRTWFRHEPDVVWRDPVTDAARIIADATAFLQSALRPARVAKAQDAE
jgi:tRNA dimethylallyltransferase